MRIVMGTSDREERRGAGADLGGAPRPEGAPTSQRLPQVHLVQMDIAWEEPLKNHERALELLDDATLTPGDFVLLPEMFATGFSFNIETTGDTNGSTLQFLMDLAADTGCYVQGGRTVTACHRCAARNVMSVIEPRVPGTQGMPGSPGEAEGSRSPRLACEYAKMHPFQGERERFEAGTAAAVWDWKPAGLRVAPVICYDLRFPEVYQEGLKLGTEMFAIGACWPSVRLAHWRALNIARAIENQAYVAAVNRVGDDPGPPRAAGLHYGGCSMVVSPMGEVLAEEWEKECVLSVPIDAAAVREWRGKFGAWRERGGSGAYES
jgi:predicted amidohydrolase